MITMSATEFKAKCLQILDQVQATGERVQVTKWGKVVAEVGPPPVEHKEYAKAGFAKGRMWIVGDIMEPIDVEWDALK